MTAALIDNPPSPARIVSILGMHRCGTSVVARLLNLLGVYLGPAAFLIKPGFDNPSGFWEHGGLTHINEQVLWVFGGNHLSPPSLPERWEFSPMLRELKLRAQEIIERDFAGPRVWGWKDPRTSLTLPFWQQLVPEMKYVICLRNPVDVALSLQARNDLSFEAGAKLWLQYANSALEHTSKRSRLLVFYEDILESWQEQARRLSHFVFSEDRTENERFRNALQEFLDVRLQHHRTTDAEALSHAAVPFAAKVLFLNLRFGVNHESRDIDALREPVLESSSVKNRQEILAHPSGGRGGIQAGSAMESHHLQFPVRTALAPDRELQQDPLPITFVSHDARRGGAPRVLLTLIEWLKREKGIDPRIILRRGGPLTEEFRRFGPVFEVEPLMDRKWEEIQSEVVKFCRGARIVYINTLVPGDIAEALTALNIPIVAHAHEMEYAIQNSCNPIHLETLLGVTDRFIAASSTVSKNLRRQYNVSPERIHTVPSFIDHSTAESARWDSAVARRDKQLPAQGLIVIGCGSVDWRKGADIFVEVARIALIELNLWDLYFYWIGAATEGFDLPHLKGLVNEMGLEKHVQFLGELEAPETYFAAADVFLLTSREDPFPLVCLEAADQGLPIFCFEKAGGMPDFVRNDAGYVAPFADAQALADKLAWLYNNADEKQRWGRNARTRVREDHTASKGGDSIWQSILQMARLPPGELSAAKNDRLRRVLTALRVTRESESSRAAQQIGELSESSRRAERYAKSLEEECRHLKEVLAGEGGRHEREGFEANKQVTALTETVRRAERYARSLEVEAQRLIMAYEGERVQRETESAEAAKQINELSEWGRSAERYAKSLEDENRRSQDSMRSAGVYAKSLEAEVERLQHAYAAESGRGVAEAFHAAETLRSVETELRRFKDHWLFRLIQRFVPKRLTRGKTR